MEGISQVWAFLQILNLHVFSSTGLKKYMETNDHKCLRDRLTRWRDMWQLLFALRRAIGVIHRISPNSLHCGKCIILHLLWYTWIATQHHWVIHWVAPNSLHIVFFDVSLKQSRSQSIGCLQCVILLLLDTLGITRFDLTCQAYHLILIPHPLCPNLCTAPLQVIYSYPVLSCSEYHLVPYNVHCRLCTCICMASISWYTVYHPSVSYCISQTATV